METEKNMNYYLEFQQNPNMDTLEDCFKYQCSSIESNDLKEYYYTHNQIRNSTICGTFFASFGIRNLLSLNRYTTGLLTLSIMIPTY